MRSSKYSKPFLIIFLAGMAFALASCGGVTKEQKYPSSGNRSANANGDAYTAPASIFGKGGLFHSAPNGDEGSGDNGIAVNSFLWRAALDTVSFMPLASADPFGGTILTDWYSPPEAPNQRFKVNVFILGKQLRSDGVRVRVFKQVNSKGSWFDSQVPADMGPQLEDAILTRARQLRIAQMGRPE